MSGDGSKTITERKADPIAENQVKKGAKALIVCGTNWHPGVIGVLTAKLMRRYDLPTLVINFKDKGLGQGSARSGPELNWVDTFGYLQHFLLAYGGHAQAAGLKIHASMLKPFKTHLLKLLERQKTVCKPNESEAEVQVSLGRTDPCPIG